MTIADINRIFKEYFDKGTSLQSYEDFSMKTTREYHKKLGYKKYPIILTFVNKDGQRMAMAFDKKHKQIHKSFIPIHSLRKVFTLK